MKILTALLLLSAKYYASTAQLEWNCLGPFLIGTRERGYDPLSAYGICYSHKIGGFEAMEYSDVNCYPSEISDFGCVKWFKVEASGQVSAEFRNVNWEFNRMFFGWAVYQTITFFKTSFNIEHAGFYGIKFNNVFHYKLDDIVYTGNGLNSTTDVPNIVYLTLGKHDLYTSQAYDIRKNGGIKPPKVLFFYDIYPIDVNDSYLVSDQEVIPEIMNGKLISDFASVTIQNPHIGNPFLEEDGWIHLIGVSAETEMGVKIPTANTLGFSVKIAPGQVYNVGIQLFPGSNLTLKSLQFTMDFYFILTKNKFSIKTPVYNLIERVWNDPYKMTFVDFDRTVQYGMIYALT